MGTQNRFAECVSGAGRRSVDKKDYWIVKRKCFRVLFAMLLTVPAWAQQGPTDLTDRSIEDLMSITVTSVSKTPQTLSRTAAAVFVITQEDIRRSGATTIPDLLRMVPGMDVGQIDSNTWAISARGLRPKRVYTDLCRRFLGCA